MLSHELFSASYRILKRLILVVFVNAVGAVGRMVGLPGKLMNPALFRLQGLSHIVDSDGALKGALGKEKGILVADAALDPSQKQHNKPEDYGGLLNPGSTLIRKVILPVGIAVGTVSYRCSLRRRKKAIRISSREYA